jgi:phage repressor protein C with HTH and peptisase S24 domain
MSETDPKAPVELGPFATRVLGWMKEHDVSGREMAKRCGLSPSYFTTLKTGKTDTPSVRVIEALSEVMGYDLFPYAMMPNPSDQDRITAAANAAHRAARVDIENQWVPGAKTTSSKLPTPNAFYAPDVPTEVTAADLYMPLDVPVLGVSMGGDETYFHFNGETVDHVRRPPGISNAKRAYATFVIGESMFPLYVEGSIVFVNPDKPPAIGDDVVLEVQLDADSPTVGYIKRLKRRTAEKIIVEQFNPRHDIEFDRNSVIAMHRVVPWNELLGI